MDYILDFLRGFYLGVVFISLTLCYLFIREFEFWIIRFIKILLYGCYLIFIIY